MRSYLFSFSTILFLVISASYGSQVSDSPNFVDSNNLESIAFTDLEDMMSCNLTFSSSQDYSCCNTDNDGCACVNLTVSGLYSYGCQGSVTDIWFESMFLCSQGQWSGVSPTIQVDLDLYAAYSGSFIVYVPVTMKYTYNCGFGTCTGSYSKNVKMIIC